MLFSCAMSQSFSHLIVHVAFSTKVRRPFLHMPATRPPLQGDSLGDVFPGLKPWAVLFSPFGRGRNVQTPPVASEWRTYLCEVL